MREFRTAPVEHAPVDNGPANGRTGAIDIFAGGVSQQIRTQLGTGGQVRRAGSRIDQQGQPRIVRNLRQRGDIRHIQFGIPYGLRKQQAGSIIDRLTEPIQIQWIHKPRRDAVVGQRLLKQGKRLQLLAVGRPV